MKVEGHHGDRRGGHGEGEDRVGVLIVTLLFRCTVKSLLPQFTYANAHTHTYTQECHNYQLHFSSPSIIGSLSVPITSYLSLMSINLTAALSWFLLPSQIEGHSLPL